MTQALTNSLNILPEKKVNLTEKMSKDDGMDFGKIFETKSDRFENKMKEFKQAADKKQADKASAVTTDEKKPVQNDNLTSVLKKTTEQNATNDSENNDINTINMSEDDSSDLNNNQENNIVIYGNITENTTKEPQDTNNTIIQPDEEVEIISAAEELITDLLFNEESDTENNTTITDEAPTMYEELLTLENPAALLMLNTQMQTVKTVIQNEQIPVADNNNDCKSDLPIQENSRGETLFKQFNNKDIVKDFAVLNNSPKNTLHSKTDNQRLSNVANENIIKELNVEVVSSQSAEAEGSMGNLMQNQTPQEQTARIMIQGDIKYEAVAAETTKNASPAKTINVTPSKIIDQISKQLEGMFNKSKLNMVLNPGTLGKLNLQLINSKEGLLAQFTVTTQEARDILMKGLDGLKESLLAQGVNVDNISVKFEDFESESKLDYTEQEGSKGGNKHQGARKQKNNDKNFEQMMFELENESNV